MTDRDQVHVPAERIHRVEHGLVVPAALRSERPRTATLVERMDFYRVPAVSIAVVNHARLEWARAYGVRHARGADTVTPRTVFQGGSLAKPVVALAALRLVERGLLSLDGDVNPRLTSWTIPPNDAWQPRVSLRQLLSHTSGLTVAVYPGYRRDDVMPTLRQVLHGARPARSEPVRVELIPGVQYRYSSGAYVVLQQLLMDVTGLPFTELMRELVLGPLGMRHSTFEQPLPARRWRFAASGHRSGAQPLPGKWFVYPETAQGGLWTTPSDLARFVLALQRAKAGRSNPVLSTEMATEMLSPQAERDIGLGLFLEGASEHRRFGHVGGNEGFSSRLTAYCDIGMGAVVMTNSQHDLLIKEVLAAIGAEYAWPGYGQEDAAGSAADPSLLERYVGDYVLPPGTGIRVTRDGELLYLATADQAAIALYQTSAARFVAKVVNAEVVFQFAHGELTGLTVEQAGRRVTAKRLG